MIISVSRRTDIPSYYSDWFFNRIKAGYAVTKNPFNHNLKKQISLMKPDVDCFVFWTKNPQPMLSRLNEIADFNYYFLFTITPYEEDIELNLPKKSKIIETFQYLSNIVGSERVIWRYDPIILTKKYSVDYHIESFGKMAESLKGFTNTVIISFIDIYSKFLKRFPIEKILLNEKIIIAKNLSKIACQNNMLVKTCAEEMDLSDFNIKHSSCIDGYLIEKLTGKTISKAKDKNQRPACGCVPSVDIGVYNTCKNGCLYCYANYSQKTILSNVVRYNPCSPEMLD